MKIKLKIFGIGMLFISFFTSSQAKNIAYSGDPAAKRGGLIGVDQGEIAGKEDKDAGIKYAAKEHESFKNPKQFYSAEYGSYTNFEIAFKKGFIIGYDHSFSGKKHAAKAQSHLPKKGLSSDSLPANNNKIPAFDPSDDAL